MYVSLNEQSSKVAVARRCGQFKLALDNAKNIRLCLRTRWQRAEKNGDQ
jgi:hypothetical protein